MITYHRTSILESRAQTVVNTINTVGVMGKGLAAAFKTRYPQMFDAYKRLCQEGKLEIGKLWLWKAEEQWILNFPTKMHWRSPSQLAYIEAGLMKFVAEYERRGIREASFPRLGCGNGGLDWSEVRPLMERYLAPLPIPIYIHDFEKDIGLPEHQERKSTEFDRSFDTFIQNAKRVVWQNCGEFRTVAKKSPFRACFIDDGSIRFERDKAQGVVTNDELYELWSLLQRGPVTRRQLPGGAGEWAYYLFAILSHVSFIRPVEVSRQDDFAALAIELADNMKTRTLPSASEREQGEFEWA